jgi:hypothetical protein
LNELLHNGKVTIFRHLLTQVVDGGLPLSHGFHSNSERTLLGPSKASGCNGEDLLFPSS